MESSKTTFKTVDEYIDSFPPEIRTRLEELRETIKKAAPKAEELVAYNMAGYKQNGPLVYFAAFKKHIGLYPRIATFKKELDKYEGGKGTVKFPLNEPIPLTLVSKMVKHQITKNSEKPTTKRKSK
jgi:uncharacterized protein YdhG (YjbR/CyaY superfamily)